MKNGGGGGGSGGGVGGGAGVGGVGGEGDGDGSEGSGGGVSRRNFTSCFSFFNRSSLLSSDLAASGLMLAYAMRRENKSEKKGKTMKKKWTSSPISVTNTKHTLIFNFSFSFCL